MDKGYHRPVIGKKDLEETTLKNKILQNDINSIQQAWNEWKKTSQTKRKYHPAGDSHTVPHLTVLLASANKFVMSNEVSLK